MQPKLLLFYSKSLKEGLKSVKVWSFANLFEPHRPPKYGPISMIFCLDTPKLQFLH